MQEKLSKGINVAKDILKGKKNNDKNPQPVIVVPVDFSDCSTRAVAQAFPIAHRINARVTLLHSYVLPSASDTFSLSPDTLAFEPQDMELDLTLEDTAKAQMNKFVKSLRDDIKAGKLPDINFETDIEEGLPEDVINEYARENNAALIVMGTRQAEKKERELVGSVTVEVLDTTRFPLLTIPENYRDDDKISTHTDVAFFCNLDNDDITALNVLQQLFPDSSFNVTFYYITSRKDKFHLVNSNETLPKLTNYCKAKYAGYKFNAKEIKPEEARELFSNNKENNINFIVVPNKRRYALARLFNPGLAHRLLFVTDIAMLVVPVGGIRN